MTTALSIIIPTLNEAHVLGKTLSQVQGQNNCEVIVVDGGSSDTTVALAQKTGCRILSSPKGRSRQMNLGAEEATGEVLLFLHADTLLPDNFATLILDAISRPGFVAGAFSLAIESSATSLAAIAWLANLRSRLLHLPYGDQALFTTRNMFYAIGRFPEIEIMEDFVFMRKISKEGRIVILPERVTTSARRWENLGILKTTLINQLIVCGYGLGVAPATLAVWYQRIRGIGKQSR